MYPFPPFTDLQFLIGLEVGQICLDPWSTQFRFADGGSIAVMGPFEHLDTQARRHHHQNTDLQDRGAVFLRELIQQQITGLEVDKQRLVLSFRNGSTLTIFSEDIPYESGQIYPPGREHKPIVF